MYQNLSPIVMTIVIIIFIAVAFTLSMPGVLIFSYLWSAGKRENSLWLRMETDLRQERKERARLQLLVDRLIRQLRIEGIVPSLTDLYITDEELIYHQIDMYFNESEIRELAFALKIDYENIQGQTKRDKARYLSTYMERHGRMGELLAVLVDSRPAVAW